jgi:hypothetical protein
MAPSSSAYLRLKRYRQRGSLERERTYLAKDWPPGYKDWNAHQWAAVKRWWIYYYRRREERLAGRSFARPRPRHWVGPAERERNRQRAPVGLTWNLAVLKHWSRF